jgi:hypothetical protein
MESQLYSFVSDIFGGSRLKHPTIILNISTSLNLGEFEFLIEAK